jgi:DNA-binding Lrp family transcriptional regulator
VDEEGRRLVVDSQKRLGRYVIEVLAKDSAFRDRILVEDVHILLGGPADMSATVRARDNDAMLEFVINGLRVCEGIQQTTTCLLQWTHPDTKL